MIIIEIELFKGLLRSSIRKVGVFLLCRAYYFFLVGRLPSSTSRMQRMSSGSVSGSSGIMRSINRPGMCSPVKKVKVP